MEVIFSFFTCFFIIDTTLPSPTMLPYAGALPLCCYPTPTGLLVQVFTFLLLESNATSVHLPL